MNSQPNRLLIRGGIIVTPDEIFRGDILVVGETIERVAPRIEDADARIIDAAGLHILPGLIDAHVHLRDPGATHKEDFTTGTRAALAGGVTTVLDMPNNPQPTTTRDALDEKRAIARAKAVCDYGFFVGATQENVEECGSVGADSSARRLSNTSSRSWLALSPMACTVIASPFFAASEPRS